MSGLELGNMRDTLDEFQEDLRIKLIEMGLHEDVNVRVGLKYTTIRVFDRNVEDISFLKDRLMDMIKNTTTHLIIYHDNNAYFFRYKTIYGNKSKFDNMDKTRFFYD